MKTYQFVLLTMLCQGLVNASNLSIDPQREDSDLQREQTHDIQFEEDKNLQREQTHDFQFKEDQDFQQEKSHTFQIDPK